jgi:hypothetical protein
MHTMDDTNIVNSLQRYRQSMAKLPYPFVNSQLYPQVATSRVDTKMLSASESESLLGRAGSNVISNRNYNITISKLDSGQVSVG